MLILYGSQTGNAQEVAESLATEAMARGIDCCALPMDCIAVSEMSAEAAIVFVCSTTGQGEVPEGMKLCWKSMLRRGLSSTTLCDTSFAVFGLGDSGYAKFNVVAKKLDRRLEQLGGIRLIEKGLGDDQANSGYEAALDPWTASLFDALQVLFPARPPGLPAPGLRQCRFTATVSHPDTSAAKAPVEASLFQQACAASATFQELSATATGTRASALPGTPSPPPNGAPAAPQRPCLQAPFWAAVSTSRRITAADHWQVVQHVEFDISAACMAYRPGDILSTLPHVPEATGRKFLERIGVATDATVTIGINAAALSGRLRARMPAAADAASATMPALAVACGVLDVAGAPPRRRLFRTLADHATAPLERERLEYYATAEARDDLATYCARERRSLLEVLSDFPSAAPPLAELLEAAPLLRPRQFSLSSSPAAHPNQAHITVAEVDFRTPFRRRVKGLCSSWLASLRPGDVAPVWIERGALVLPPPHVPLVCVGPGTGIAPFRSFLWERFAAVSAGHAVAPSVLVLGCRNKSKDFLYAEEWEDMLQAGVLRREGGLLCAFSRDQPEKRYVQHCIREQRQGLWHMLHACNASVFVAGSASKLPAAVADAFVDVIAEGLGCPADQAQKLQRQLEGAKRYSVEAWG